MEAFRIIEQTPVITFLDRRENELLTIQLTVRTILQRGGKPVLIVFQFVDDLIPRGRRLQKYSCAAVFESNKLSCVAASLQYVHRLFITNHRYSVASKASREPAYHSLRYDFAVFPAFHGVRNQVWGSRELVGTPSVRVQSPENPAAARIPAESQSTVSRPCRAALLQSFVSNRP